jgi:riboflavin kinase/FMN adenylyltransferase
MKVLSAPAEFSPDARPVCAAIGVFDGVHLGHQAVLRQTLEDAKGLGAWSVAVTFDRHPNTIVAPAHVPPLIYPLSKKLETLSALGLDAAYVIRFDQTFSQIPGERFVLDLARDFGQIKSISVGETFMFGQKRSGNVALLRRLGPALGFEVRALPDVAESGQPISSTRIREALRVGALEAASRMLGRAYSLRGAVIPGLRLGRQLGFPTANLQIAGLAVPPTGVYVADALLGQERFRAAVNIGHRPTVSPVPQLLVEAHLLAVDRDIYHQELELVFLKKLRDEHRFPSQNALRAQIAKDVADAAKYPQAKAV